MPFVGGRLGPYSVTAKIGEGGMGEMSAAVDRSARLPKTPSSAQAISGGA